MEGKERERANARIMKSFNDSPAPLSTIARVYKREREGENRRAIKDGSAEFLVEGFSAFISGE